MRDLRSGWKHGAAKLRLVHLVWKVESDTSEPSAQPGEWSNLLFTRLRGFAGRSNKPCISTFLGARGNCKLYKWFPKVTQNSRRQAPVVGRVGGFFRRNCS